MRTALILLLAAAAATATEPVDVAVERDGSTFRRKELVFDAEAGLLRWKHREYPLADYYLVEGENGRLLWSPDYASRIRGYEFLARAEIRDQAEKLFRRAVSYKDPALARRLFEIAQDHGADGREVEKMRRKLQGLERRPGNRNAKADEVTADAEKLASVYADILFARTKEELARKGDHGLRMLRDVLLLEPRHAGARAALAAVAPRSFALGDARIWLDWHLDVEKSGAKLSNPDTFNMRQARKYWRKDLNGIEAGVVLVITPVTDSRVLGRMLGCCRLTTAVLGELFGDYPVRRKKVDPLRIFLFENKEEYVKRSGDFRPSKDMAFLEWSAGHYSPEEGISRLFWVTDRDAESRIIGTAVHELTHHWLADANPAYAPRDGRRSPRCPGFWIVEGFAEFLEEGQYDIEAGTWSLFDQRADSLDTVITLADAGKLLNWRMLYEGSSLHFWALDKSKKFEVRRRWQLGADVVTQTHLWYMQSAATCHYLYHAENGKHRKALLDYLVAHYTSDAKRMPTSVAFGLQPEALGKNVVDFAKKVRDGWRPASSREKGSSRKKGGHDGK